MPDNDANRRLATIVAMDIFGYSRLMGEDEAGTLARMKAARALIDPLNEAHGGRLVNTAGDGLLLEFSSVVNAVTCAIEVQNTLAEYNADTPEDKKMLYRIGINLGDVLSDGDDIFGDGVNIAARIEGLVEPGQIGVSRTVRDSVRDRMDIVLADMGQIEVKNIARPVHVFQVVGADGKVPVRPTKSGVKSQMFAGVAILCAIILAGGLWWLKPWQPDVEPASQARMSIPLPDKPSIAVMPFTNLSDDKSQEYFALGMSEDIITDLSKITGLIVIARNSSFRYKGDSVDLKKVGRELNVKYVLEGSVRRVADKIRINAQLIDVQSATHLWAERYDGSLSDVFVLQDQITAKIVENMTLKLMPGMRKRSDREVDPVAYGHFLKGRAALSQIQLFSGGSHARIAKVNLEKSVELDPTNPEALANLGWFYFLATNPYYGVQHGNIIAARELAKKSLEIEENASALMLKSAVIFEKGKYKDRDKRDEDALRIGKMALQMAPSNILNNEYYGSMLLRTGRLEAALLYLSEARRIDPFGQGRFGMGLGLAHILAGNLVAAEKLLRKQTEFWVGSVSLSRIFLIAALGAQGKRQAAKEMSVDFFKNCGFCTILAVKNAMRFTLGFRSDAILEPLFKGLRQAGYPEEPE